MDEYIELNAAIAKIDPDEYYHSNEVKDILRDVPAADVEPVRHAYWVPEERVDRISEAVTYRNTRYLCSACGRALVAWEKPIDAITSVNLEPSTNGPLTIEELRKMDGDKIYIQFIGVCKGFCDDEYAPYYGQHEQYIQKHNGMLICCDLLLKYYGEAWLAYRRKPDCSHWKDEEADHEQ